MEAEPPVPDLKSTRDAIFGEIGTVQFPELMMEIDSHTRFSSALLGREPTSWEELLSVYCALLAHGTDMTPTGMATRDISMVNIPAHRGRRPEELVAISGSLTLLSNITIAGMTLQMQQVIDRWKREEGRRVDPELLRHSRPARSEGVNFHGKLDFPVRQYQERLLATSARRN